MIWCKLNGVSDIDQEAKDKVENWFGDDAEVIMGWVDDYEIHVVVATKTQDSGDTVLHGIRLFQMGGSWVLSSDFIKEV